MNEILDNSCTLLYLYTFSGVCVLYTLHYVQSIFLFIYWKSSFLFCIFSKKEKFVSELHIILLLIYLFLYSLFYSAHYKHFQSMHFLLIFSVLVCLIESKTCYAQINDGIILSESMNFIYSIFFSSFFFFWSIENCWCLYFFVGILNTA